MARNVKKLVNQQPVVQQEQGPHRWCDSTVNGVVGDPTYFVVRMVVPLKWADLTGQERATRPWLNGQPRLILLSDAEAGDQPAVPGRCSFGFLKAKVIDRIRSAAPAGHRWLLLTTSPDRLLEFSEWLRREHGQDLPNNLWVGTVVKTMADLDRVARLNRIGGDGTGRFIVVEPQQDEIRLGDHLAGLSWVVLAGEARPGATFRLEWVRRLRDECAAAGIPFFVDRLGAGATEGGEILHLNDTEGADWTEWPQDLRVREVATGVRGALPPGPPLTLLPVERRNFRLASEIEEQPVEWLWTGYIPLGELTVLDGDPGTNKSSLLLDLAARLTTGRPMLDLSPAHHGGAVLLAGEDSARKTLAHRLRVAGADRVRVAILEPPITVPEGIPRIEEAVLQVGARLVVVDPISLFLGRNVLNDQAVRQAMTPLRAMAERTNVAVVLVRHLTKTGSRNALYRGSGSIGLVAAIRSALLVAKAPHDGDLRVVCQVKNNLGPISPSFLFEPVGSEQGLRIEYRGESDLAAEDLFGTGGRPADKLDQAKILLLRLLAGGPVRQADIERQAAAEGVSYRTVERAKRVLGVVSRREGFGQGGAVNWELPRH